MILQGLRDALRDFRRQSNGQLSGEIDARSRATGELEVALGQVREKDKAVAAANAEVAQLQEQLEVGGTTLPNSYWHLVHAHTTMSGNIRAFRSSRFYPNGPHISVESGTDYWCYGRGRRSFFEEVLACIAVALRATRLSDYPLYICSAAG